MPLGFGPLGSRPLGGFPIEPLVIAGTLAASEGQDSAIFTGLAGITGSLAASESSDVATMVGTVVAPPLVDYLLAFEQPDIASFSGRAVFIYSGPEAPVPGLAGGVIALEGTADEKPSLDGVPVSVTIDGAGNAQHIEGR